MKRLAVLSALACLLFAAAASAQEQLLCVTASRANLRAGPSTDFRITWEVNRYMPLMEVERQGEWVKVSDVDGDVHWIYGPLVSSGENCVTVKASRANIRKGPTTDADMWFTVEKYTSFKRVGQQGNWIRLEYQGEEMWVFHTLVWPVG